MIDAQILTVLVVWNKLSQLPSDRAAREKMKRSATERWLFARPGSSQAGLSARRTKLFRLLEEDTVEGQRRTNLCKL